MYVKKYKKNRSFDKYFCVLSTLNDILFREFNLGFLEDSNPLTSMKNTKKKIRNWRNTCMFKNQQKSNFCQKILL